jgi:uncharacterized alpha-E superfamily protein
MALLSRVADRIYWAARYLERAEDTSRLVRSFQDLFADMPLTAAQAAELWPTLMVVSGDSNTPEEPDEAEVVHFLVTDRDRPGSVVSCVAAARENLRTTREVLPREAWQALNDLWMSVDRDAERAVERRFRGRFLDRVTDESRRLDGILTSTMNRDAAFDMWRLGRYLERADMTTRVVGVRAASLMATAGGGGRPEYDEVQWMSVLRSLSALQMYQRSTRGSINGASVVRFLLYERRFPRSVAAALDEIDLSLERLRRSESVAERVAEARSVLRSTSPSATDGSNLDLAMERVQIALATIDVAITNRYLRLESDG